MKTKKEDAASKESVLRRVVKSKQKILKPKAGASLEKAVKNVKQVFKEKRAEAKAAKKKEASLTKPKPGPGSKPKQFKARKLGPRGMVYVGHIPHGFYEEQMNDYFKQFGNVTRVRIARSKRTGSSRGYGYVEFLHPDVARIAADTMNNYLMCGRLLKATYIPPEKQHFGFFAGVNWSKDKYPRLVKRKEVTLRRNRTQSAEDHERYVKRSLRKLSTLESKLKDKGISMKFQPVDAPET
ncbi:MKI67 FHA domain-interacting nucleolar phosphoprotein-like [Temnothorax longispinosus]|uniref:MKI67 FHA domain-interacting nucleolar phosphoprotein-like protein n=1 Tax=Temnothorax longispinosus TaxID=300112 RepID=A0A4S2KNI4_9HYME|nr:MKI67 FHA domain-interacting nucleolar phosphoprotein-like protein [Temnothorax longispinosus]